VLNLHKALRAQREKIVSLWVDRTLDSYISSGFFKTSRDRFANPVGANIREGLGRLYDQLLEGVLPEKMLAPLDQVIRIRAVQEFSPSQAVAPILELKWVVRKVLGKQRAEGGLETELDGFDLEVERLALLAFDMYTECREQLYRNRIQELKSGRHILTDSGCVSSLVRQQPAPEA
jgi:hypothetical protein